MSGMIGRVDTAQVRREMIRMNGRASRKRFLIGAVVVLAVALLVGEAASRCASAWIRPFARGSRS